MFSGVIKIGRQEYSLWVLLGMVLLSVMLGVLNNLRVYEEQRVPWMGAEEESAADGESEQDMDSGLEEEGGLQ